MSDYKYTLIYKIKSQSVCWYLSAIKKKHLFNSRLCRLISRKKWKHYSVDDKRPPVIAVREKKMGYLKASKNLNVPRASFCQFINEKVTPIDILVSKTKTDMRRIAFQLAIKKNMPNPSKNKIAGRYWLDGFLKRRKDRLSMIAPLALD